MNTERAAQAIKDYLIALKIAKKLPKDLNNLDVDSIREVLDAQFHELEDAYDEAGSFLVGDDELTVKEMVDLIVANEDQTEIIDNIEGVVVWEKVENTFSCKEFLNLINYPS